MEKVLSTIGVLALLVLSVFVELHVIQRMWELVLVPVGLPALTGYKQAWGLSLFASIFTLAALSSKADKDQDYNARIFNVSLTNIIGCLMVWGITSIFF